METDEYESDFEEEDEEEEDVQEEEEVEEEIDVQEVQTDEYDGHRSESDAAVTATAEVTQLETRDKVVVGEDDDEEERIEEEGERDDGIEETPMAREEEEVEMVGDREEETKMRAQDEPDKDASSEFNFGADDDDDDNDIRLARRHDALLIDDMPRSLGLPRGLLPACDNRRKTTQQHYMRLLGTPSSDDRISAFVASTSGSSSKALLRRNVNTRFVTENLAVLRDNGSLVTYVHRERSNLYATTSTTSTLRRTRTRGVEKMVWLSSSAKTAVLLRATGASDLAYSLHFLQLGARSRRLPPIPGMTLDVLAQAHEELVVNVSDAAGDAAAVAATYRNSARMYRCFLWSHRGGAWQDVTEFLVCNSSHIGEESIIALKSGFFSHPEDGRLFVDACVVQTKRYGSSIHAMSLRLPGLRHVNDRYRGHFVSLPTCSATSISPSHTGASARIAWAPDAHVLALTFSATSRGTNFVVRLFSRSLEHVSCISWEEVTGSHVHCCCCEWTTDSNASTTRCGSLLAVMDSNLVTAFFNECGESVRVIIDAGDAALGTSRSWFSWRNTFNQGSAEERKALATPKRVALSVNRFPTHTTTRSDPSVNCGGDGARIALLCNKLLFELDCHLNTESRVRVVAPPTTLSTDMRRCGKEIVHFNETATRDIQLRVAVAPSLRASLAARARSLVSKLAASRFHSFASFTNDNACRVLASSSLQVEEDYIIRRGGRRRKQNRRQMYHAEHALRQRGLSTLAVASLQSYSEDVVSSDNGMSSRSRAETSKSSDDDHVVFADAALREVRTLRADSTEESSSSRRHPTAGMSKDVPASISDAEKLMLLGRIRGCESQFGEDDLGTIQRVALQVVELNIEKALVLLRKYVRGLASRHRREDVDTSLTIVDTTSSRALVRLARDIGKLGIASLSDSLVVELLAFPAPTQYADPSSSPSVAGDKTRQSGNTHLSSDVFLLAEKAAKAWRSAVESEAIDIRGITALALLNVHEHDDDASAISTATRLQENDGHCRAAIALLTSLVVVSSSRKSTAIEVELYGHLESWLDDIFATKTASASTTSSSDFLSELMRFSMLLSLLSPSPNSSALRQKAVSTVIAAAASSVSAIIACEQASKTNSCDAEEMDQRHYTLRNLLKALLTAYVVLVQPTLASTPFFGEDGDGSPSAENDGNAGVFIHELMALAWTWKCHTQVLAMLGQNAMSTVGSAQGEDGEGIETALWALELLRVVSSSPAPPCNVHASQELMINAIETCTSLPQSIVSQIDEESDEAMLPAAREKWSSIRHNDESLHISLSDDNEDSESSASMRLEALRQSTRMCIRSTLMRIARLPEDTIEHEDANTSSDFVNILHDAANSCMDSRIYQDTIHLSQQIARSEDNDTMMSGASSVFDAWAELMLVARNSDEEHASVVDEFIAGARELHAIALLASHQTTIPASVVAGASMTVLLDALADGLSDDGATTRSLASAIRAALALLSADGRECVARLAAVCVASGYALQLIVNDPLLSDDDLRRRFHRFSHISEEDEGRDMVDTEEVDTRQDVASIRGEEQEDATVSTVDMESVAEYDAEIGYADEHSHEVRLEEGDANREQLQSSSSAHIDEDVVNASVEPDTDAVPLFGEEDGYEGDKDQGADTVGDVGTSEPSADSPMTEDLSDADAIQEEEELADEQVDDATEKESVHEDGAAAQSTVSIVDIGDVDDTMDEIDISQTPHSASEASVAVVAAEEVTTQKATEERNETTDVVVDGDEHTDTDTLAATVAQLQRDLAVANSEMEKRITEIRDAAASAALQAIREQQQQQQQQLVEQPQPVVNPREESKPQQRRDGRLQGMMARLRTNGARNRALSNRRRTRALQDQDTVISNVVVVDCEKIKSAVLAGEKQIPSVVVSPIRYDGIVDTHVHGDRSVAHLEDVTEPDCSDVVAPGQDKVEAEERGGTAVVEGKTPETQQDSVEDDAGDEAASTTTTESDRSFKYEENAGDDNTGDKIASRPTQYEGRPILDSEDAYDVLESLGEVRSGINPFLECATALLSDDRAAHHHGDEDELFAMRVRVNPDVPQLLRLLCPNIGSARVHCLCAIIDLQSGRECSISELIATVREAASATRAARLPRHAGVWETVHALLGAVRIRRVAALAILCGTFVNSPEEGGNTRSDRLVRFIRRTLPSAQKRHVRYLMAVFLEAGLCADNDNPSTHATGFDADVFLDNVELVLATYAGEAAAHVEGGSSSWMAEVAEALRERREMNAAMHASAVVIQAAFRGCMARRRLQKQRIEVEEKIRNDAARTIQRAIRAHLQTRVLTTSSRADTHADDVNHDSVAGVVDPIEANDTATASLSSTSPTSSSSASESGAAATSEVDARVVATTAIADTGSGGVVAASASPTPIEIKVCVVPYSAFHGTSTTAPEATPPQAVESIPTGTGADILIPVPVLAAPVCTSPPQRAAISNAETQTEMCAAVSDNEGTTQEERATDNVTSSVAQETPDSHVVADFDNTNTIGEECKTHDDNDEDQDPVASRDDVHVHDHTLDSQDLVASPIPPNAGMSMLSANEDDHAFLHVADITYEECLSEINILRYFKSHGKGRGGGGATQPEGGRTGVVDVQAIIAQHVSDEEERRRTPAMSSAFDAAATVDANIQDCSHTSTTARDDDDDDDKYGLAHESGYVFISDPPPVVRNALSAAEYARAAERLRTSTALQEREIIKLRRAKVAQLQSEYERARSSHRRRVDSVIEEVRAALVDVTDSAAQLEDEMMSVRRVMRGVSPTIERVRLEELQHIGCE